MESHHNLFLSSDNFVLFRLSQTRDGEKGPLTIPKIIPERQELALQVRFLFMRISFTRLHFLSNSHSLNDKEVMACTVLLLSLSKLRQNMY